MTETTTSKSSAPVTIENVEQASSNFYWIYKTQAGDFNLQTTIRGILKPDQIQAHVKSVLEAAAHIQQLGGLPKGKYDSTPSSPLPESTQVETIIADLQASDPLWHETTTSTAIDTTSVAPDEGKSPSAADGYTLSSAGANEDTFETQKLLVTITNGKKYFKIKGGHWMAYGVKVWDEVLVGAKINVGQLEGKEYDLKGFRATYNLRADGKPDKVIKLERVA